MENQTNETHIDALKEIVERNELDVETLDALANEQQAHTNQHVEISQVPQISTYWGPLYNVRIMKAFVDENQQMQTKEWNYKVLNVEFSDEEVATFRLKPSDDMAIDFDNSPSGIGAVHIPVDKNAWQLIYMELAEPLEDEFADNPRFAQAPENTVKYGPNILTLRQDQLPQLPNGTFCIRQTIGSSQLEIEGMPENKSPQLVVEKALFLHSTLASQMLVRNPIIGEFDWSTKEMHKNYQEDMKALDAMRAAVEANSDMALAITKNTAEEEMNK